MSQTSTALDPPKITFTPGGLEANSQARSALRVICPRAGEKGRRGRKRRAFSRGEQSVLLCRLFPGHVRQCWARTRPRG